MSMKKRCVFWKHFLTLLLLSLDEDPNNCSKTDTRKY